MKLFRTAFWLGVVIYNLPSPDSQPAAPESQVGSQGSPVHCAKNTDTHPKRGDPVAQSSSRKAATPSKDTLAPADRAVPWRGPASCNPPPPLTASAGTLTRSLGSAACFGSAGLRSAQITSSPYLIQARPSVAPTDPAPMIAIRMNTLLIPRANEPSAFSAPSKSETPKLAAGDNSRHHTSVVVSAECRGARRF